MDIIITKKIFLPECIDNVNVNENIAEINDSIDSKNILNSNIIYNFSIIYEKYLHENNNNLKFQDFIEHNKDNYEYIEICKTRIKDKFKKCYNLLSNILHIDKKILIYILSRFRLTYIKVYKLIQFV